MSASDKLALAFDKTAQFTDMSRPPRPLLDTVKGGVGEVKTVRPLPGMSGEEIRDLADHERARDKAARRCAPFRMHLTATL